MWVIDMGNRVIVSSIMLYDGLAWEHCEKGFFRYWGKGNFLSTPESVAKLARPLPGFNVVF